MTSDSAPRACQLRLFRDEDRAAVLRLSSQHHPESELRREEYLSWLLAGTPAGRPFAVVATDPQSGDVVGFVWNIPLNVTINGLSRRCYMSCDGLVHPDYRRRGLYVDITRRALDFMGDADLKYGFAKPIALYSLQAGGVKTVCRVPLLVRPLDMGRLVDTRVPGRARRLAMTMGWQVAANTLFRPSPADGRRWGLRVAAEATFDRGFDDFWERVKLKYSLIVDRNRAFLAWRFGGPEFRGYVTLTARVGDLLVGYAVIRAAEVQGIPTGLILDLLVEPGVRGTVAGCLIVAEAKSRFKSSGVALAGSLMLRHTHEYAILRQAGFVECPARFSPQPFRIVAKPLNEGGVANVVWNPESWFVTMANHDAV